MKTPIKQTRTKAKTAHPPFRVVHVGCGGMAGAWLQPASQMPGYEIVGLVDLNQSAAEGRRREFGLTDAVAGVDLKAILASTGAQVVFNCTIPTAHYPVTMEALRAGCHVLSEKPLANNMVEARRMVAEAERRELVFAVLQNYRYRPEIRHIRKLIARNIIGKVSALHADFQIGAHFGGFRDEMDHVLLLDMAIHTFDMARFLGGVSPQAVYCHEFNPPESWYRHGAAAHAIFEMSGDVVFNYRGSWCAQGVPGSWNCAWRIQGAKGAILWDGASGIRVEKVVGRSGFHRQTEVREEVVTAPKNALTGHAAILSEFHRCLQKGGTLETIASDNIHSLAMVFGAIASADKKRREMIQPIKK